MGGGGGGEGGGGGGDWGSEVELDRNLTIPFNLLHLPCTSVCTDFVNFCFIHLL